MKRTIVILAILFFFAGTAFAQPRMEQRSSPLTGNATDGYSLPGSLAIGISGQGTLSQTIGGVTKYDTSGNSVWSLDNAGNVMQQGTLDVRGGTAATIPSIKTAGAFAIAAGARMYLDGGANTYLIEATGDRVAMYTGGVIKQTWESGGGIGIGISTGFLSGITSHMLFASGVSPTGTVTGGAGLYAYQNQLWAVSADGTHNQLTSHDPETGEKWLHSYNSFTGEGRKYYPETGVLKTYAVPKINPEDEYKMRWMETHPAWVESTRDAAVEPNIIKETFYQVVEKKVFYPHDGSTVSTIERIPYTTIQKQEGYKLKDDHRVHPETGAFEKKTTPATIPPFDWSKMPAHVRAAWGK